MFKITNFLSFDHKGRASCPCCETEKGANKNLSLVPNTDGAYKCFRGCSPEQIRDQLGTSAQKQVPVTEVKSFVKTCPPSEIKQDRERLVLGKTEVAEQARQWLLGKNINPELWVRHSLGLRRVRVKEQMVYAISIPIPANPERTSYYRKYRVQPWLDHKLPRWHQPGVPGTVLFTHKPGNATGTWLCEGEWDAIRLGQLVRESNLSVAVASLSTGCQSVPSDHELARLPGNVAIFYDRNDAPLKNGSKPGETGAQKVAKALGHRASIRLVPGKEEQVAPVKGWDVSNAIDAGYTVADFQSAETIEKDERAKTLRDRLISTAQLMARAPDYIDFLIPDLLTYELYLLAAPPRSGKTLLTMTLAKAIASGDKFLDRPTTKGSVLYINLEDSETKVKSRALAQDWDVNLPVFWIDKFKLEELPELIPIIEQMPDLRLVVIDTLSRAKSSQITESSAEMSSVLEPLQELCKVKNICTMLVHHTGKVKEHDGALVDVFDNIRGSSAIRATARGCWIILPGENCYRLVTENGFSKEDLKIRLNPSTWGWDLLGKWSPQVDGSQKDQILEYLRLVTQATVSQISTGTTIPAKTVGTVLGRLQADDLVTKIGGSGRQPATYVRSSNLLQQLEQKLEYPNPDTADDSGLLQQKNIFPVRGSDQGENCHIPPDPADPLFCIEDQASKSTSEKVLPPSDPADPFCPPQVVGASAEEGCNASLGADSNSNFCSNNGNLLEQVGAKVSHPELILSKKEDQMMYWSKIDTLVEVKELKGDRARIRVPGKPRSQWVQRSELRDANG